jgi:pantoate--beta-alanine ligase
LIRDLETWHRVRGILEEVSVGFVPTMGALHEGHLELIRQAVRENERCVISIFVNAPQFNDASDLEAYPRALDDDCVAASEAGADFVLAPPHEAIYPDGYRYRVTENRLSLEMEGEHRPGHFDGVLTVVLKLLQLVRPQRVYFGEKDYQQYLLVKGMVEAFFLPIEVVACPTVRDPRGLALCSRNLRLSEEGRERAALLYELLESRLATDEVSRRLRDAGFEVEYIREVGDRRYGAVHLEGVRLIDNVVIEGRS